METRELQAAVEKSRRFTHEVDGKTFDCVLPTQYAAQVIRGETKTATHFQRRLVLAALRDWSNVRASDVVPEAGSSPLPYTEAAAELFFGERPDVEEGLADAIVDRMAARRKREDAALGN